MKFDEESYVVFHSLSKSSNWDELKKTLIKNLEGLRAESDTINDEKEIRISQGRRMMLNDLIKSVDGSGVILEKLKQIK